MTAPQDIIADVGGTFFRIALVVQDNFDENRVFTGLVSDYSCLSEAIGDFMHRFAVNDAGRLYLAIPLPMCAADNPLGYRKRRSSFDHIVANWSYHWKFDFDSVIEGLRIQDIFVLNDLEALAHSFIANPRDIYWYSRPAFDAPTSRIIIYIGTGVGVASIVKLNSRCSVVLPSEASSNYAPSTSGHHASDTWTNLLGTPQLISRIAAASGKKIDFGNLDQVVETIIEAKIGKSMSVLDEYIKYLHLFISELAHVMTPRGGVLCGGHIVRALHRNKVFMTKDISEFVAKRAVSNEFLDQVPIGVITRDVTALEGLMKFRAKSANEGS